MKATEALAINLKRLRKSLKLSQEALAEKSVLTQVTITDIEREKTFVTKGTIGSLAKALGVEETALFCRSHYY